MFANCSLGGMDLAMPDVCLVPAVPAPIPTPFPNIAQGPLGVPAAYTCLFGGAPAHNLGTLVPTSNGDEAGMATGVASGVVMGPARHLMGSNTVLVGGMPATRMTSPSLQNSTNAPGVRLAPSQVVVVILAG